MNKEPSACREAYKSFLQKCGDWKAQHVNANDGKEIWDTAWQAAIRDSNAELREALEYYADEIRYGRVHMAADSYGEYLASDVMFDQGKIAKEALARHNADKGEV